MRGVVPFAKQVLEASTKIILVFSSGLVLCGLKSSLVFVFSKGDYQLKRWVSEPFRSPILKKQTKIVRGVFLLNCGNGLPSWELKYPHPRHVWTWCSFSPVGICQFPAGYCSDFKKIIQLLPKQTTQYHQINGWSWWDVSKHIPLKIKGWKLNRLSILDKAISSNSIPIFMGIFTRAVLVFEVMTFHSSSFNPSEKY